MSTTTSCYSTMVLDKDGNVAYLFEENSNGGYDIQYRNFTVNVSFTSGIDTLNLKPESLNLNPDTFNLSGQRVPEDTPGLVIRNNRKLLVR